MLLPRYYLPRPAVQSDPQTIAAFEALWAQIEAGADGREVAYHLPQPRWQFLCYLADHKPVLLHGSGSPGIRLFEPRQADDFLEFGNRAAVYAASDGIWPMYYAILDRERYPMSLTNACIRVADPSEDPGDPYYFFSISRDALAQLPWREGTVYILPRATFAPQPPIVDGDATIYVMQWASPEPVAPLARLRVGPDDFPFLGQIRGHDDQQQQQRARANPNGFPWVDDE